MRRHVLVPSLHVNRKRDGRRAAASASEWLGRAAGKAIEAKGFPKRINTHFGISLDHPPQAAGYEPPTKAQE